MLQARNKELLPDLQVQRPLGRSVSVLTVLAIAVLTLTPSHAETTGSAWECVFCGERAVADALVNVILYLPLGVGLVLVGVRTGYVVLLGAALSTTVEALQIVLPGRDASTGDVIANTLGTTFGVLVARSAPIWLRPSRPGASVLCAGAAAMAAMTFLVTAYLLAPSLPRSVYYGQWTPRLGHLEWYRGQVQSVAIRNDAVPAGRAADSEGLRAALLRGDTVNVRAVAGPRVPALASLFSVYDGSQREIFLVGPDRDEFVIRYRTRSVTFGLDRADLRVSQTDDLTPGDSFSLKTWGSPRGLCFQLDTDVECGLGFTIGSGWSLLYYAESFPRWLRRLLDLAWVAGFFALIGFWARPGVVGPVAAATALCALLIVPLVSDLVSTPAVQWLASSVGLATGQALHWRGATLLRHRSGRLSRTAHQIPADRV